MNLQIEKILAWNGEHDTGKDARLKINANFQVIKEAIENGIGFFPNGSIVQVNVGFLNVGDDISGMSAIEVLSKMLFGNFPAPILTIIPNSYTFGEEGGQTWIEVTISGTSEKDYTIGNLPPWLSVSDAISVEQIGTKTFAGLSRCSLDEDFVLETPNVTSLFMSFAFFASDYANVDGGNFQFPASLLSQLTGANMMMRTFFNAGMEAIKPEFLNNQVNVVELFETFRNCAESTYEMPPFIPVLWRNQGNKKGAL